VDPSSPFLEVETVGGPEGKKKRRKELDHIDDIMAQYWDAAAADNLLRKKPAGAEKGRKKVAAEGSEDESDHEEEEDDEESSVEEAPPKAKAASKAASKAAAKAKAAAAAKPVAALKPGKAPPAIAKRPAGVEALDSSEFPKLPKKGSVYWRGGRVYKTKKGDMVRVYARSTDRADKRGRFDDAASLNAAWDKACHVIANDTRERPPALPRGRKLAT